MCRAAPCLGTDTDLDVSPRGREGPISNPHPASLHLHIETTDAGVGGGYSHTSSQPSPVQPPRHTGCCNFLRVYSKQLLQCWRKGEAGTEIHFESQLYLGLNHLDGAIYTFPPLWAVHKAQRGPIIHFRILLWNALSSQCFMAHERGLLRGTGCTQQVALGASCNAPPSVREMDSW